MKARIISTGEEVELVDSIVHDEDGNEYDLEDLFFFGAPIDWGQRRYEIAKEVLASCPFSRIREGVTVESYVNDCIVIADAFIRQLKKTENEAKRT